MKTLVITGASKGIGFATAQLYLEAGYRVINISRTPAPDDRVDNQSLDLSLDDVEAKLTSLANAKFDGSSEIILIHNAAKLEGDVTHQTATAIFRDIVNINLVSSHILNQIFIPLMASGSAVIYVGSTLSEKAVPGSYSYVVTKHAMIGMMRATCQDLAGAGIHTACVCPGFTNTEMLRAHVGHDEEILASIATNQTFNRLVEPGEIADTLFFAGTNPVINGAVIHANLGQVEN